MQAVASTGEAIRNTADAVKEKINTATEPDEKTAGQQVKEAAIKVCFAQF